MIGEWVARVSRDEDRMVSKVHYVESEIADRVVTQCGRQMKRDLNGEKLAFAYVPGDDEKCQAGCKGKAE